MAKNEFGDFQTPLPLALQCLQVLGLPCNARVIEPTCGQGAFLEAATRLAPRCERQGIELNALYVEQARQWGQVQQGNIFEIPLAEAFCWKSTGPLYLIGNPPWVTSAQLKRMNAVYVPAKENIKNMPGFEALLGASNFDVCEFILLKALHELWGQNLTVGVLCKTHVARKVLEYAVQKNMPFCEGKMYHINALQWFGASVDACWFSFAIRPGQKATYQVKEFKDLFDPHKDPTNTLGMVKGRLVSDVKKYASFSQADNLSPYQWRSGLKHDAASVFELQATPEPMTRDKQRVDVEEEYLYPLVKSSDLYHGQHQQLTKWVVVPQRRLGEETSTLQVIAPKLWRFLESHSDLLDARKSSIYRGAPRFSVFGLGRYSFAPYKVAVSGLHKRALFRLVGPLENKPVMLDDTCYFIPFDNVTEALMVQTMFNSPEAQALIESIVFWDAKRPVTKKLLSRLSVQALPLRKESLLEKAQNEAHSLNVSFDEALARKILG